MELDMVCFSDIRWAQEAQRPPQLMRRAAKEQRVFYIEGPHYQPGPPRLLLEEVEPGALWKVTPQVPDRLSSKGQEEIHSLLIRQLFEVHKIRDYAILVNTPAAVRFLHYFKPRLLIYDCLTRFGPKDGMMFDYETELLQRADLVISDSQQIFSQPGAPERQLIFPGSLEVERFFEARRGQGDPPDQAAVPHPRLGFWGVINRMFDRRLVEAVADLRPDWHIILLGPITVDPGSLFNRSNVHYMSTRTLSELPAYLSGWDAAILPLAWWEPRVNIAATQIPQYLAGGCPVVTTQAPMVVRCFESRRLVETADTPDGFVLAVERALAQKKNQPDWLGYVDSQLAGGAWDLAWEWLSQSISLALQRREQARQTAPFEEVLLNTRGEDHYG